MRWTDEFRVFGALPEGYGGSAAELLSELYGAGGVGSAVTVERAVAAVVVRAAFDVDLVAGVAEDGADLGAGEVGVRADDECADAGDGGAGGGGESEAGGVECFAVEEGSDGRRGEVGLGGAHGVVGV